MEPFTILHSRAVPLALGLVDTDRIIPARFLKQPRGPAYRDFLFHDLRVGPDGQRTGEFPLDQPRYAGARILIANADFGVGSAREHAVWALKEFGIRAVIAPGLGDTFRANCVRNGVLAIVLSATEIAALLASLDGPLIIDLARQVITMAVGTEISFAIDAFDKEALLTGLDEIALTLRSLPAIDAFEAQYRAATPWLRVRRFDFS